MPGLTPPMQNKSPHRLCFTSNLDIYFLMTMIFLFDCELVIVWQVGHYLKIRISEASLKSVSSPLLSDDVNPSDLSSLSDSLTLDDGKCPGIAILIVFHSFLPHLGHVTLILTKQSHLSPRWWAHFPEAAVQVGSVFPKTSSCRNSGHPLQQRQTGLF